MANRRNIVDVTGQRYGRLVAELLVVELGRDTSWLCRCDCGGQKVVGFATLRAGRVTSCGCAATVHGMRKSPEYTVWWSMIQRCTSEAHKSYDKYGGRGITVCDEWRHNFAAFYRHVGRRPSSVHSLDRIDNDGGYKPGNVRWATAKEQAANRRPMPGRKKSTLDGQPITYRAIAEFLAMTTSTYKHRMGGRP